MIVDDVESMRQRVIEELGTMGRLKLVAFLAQRPNETETSYSLSAATGFNREDIERSMDHLLSIGWVTEERNASSRYGRYRFNVQNERARLFVEFLRQTGYQQ